MSIRSISAVCALLASLAALHAADIQGTVIIKRRLSRKAVTAAVPLYQRGAFAKLGPETGSEADEDPLAFERTHVAIWLEGDLPSQKETETMEQKNRLFLPDLLVVSAGSTVTFPNLDAIFHNVFSFSKAKTFDLGNYPKNQSRNVVFSKPGVVFVNCRLHPNMSAAIVVTPNKWHTRPEEDGRYTLRNVPPGKYTLTAWHKSAGFFHQSVIVDQQRGASADFLIPFDEK